jgi:hypothetical protein
VNVKICEISKSAQLRSHGEVEAAKLQVSLGSAVAAMYCRREYAESFKAVIPVAAQLHGF